MDTGGQDCLTCAHAANRRPLGRTHMIADCGEIGFCVVWLRERKEVSGVVIGLRAVSAKKPHDYLAGCDSYTADEWLVDRFREIHGGRT